MTGPADPTVSVIVLNYNGRHLFEECLASLFRQLVGIRLLQWYLRR